MNIEKVIDWFKAAKPNPTSKDVLVQFGCHFEEIKEMCNAMNLHCDDVALQELRFKSACAPYLKGVESIDETQAVEILDSLCDQIVTAIGVGYMMGFDMSGALKEVNLSNWSKFDENGNPIFNENGKIVKGENYFKPDLAKFVRSDNAPAAE